MNPVPSNTQQPNQPYQHSKVSTQDGDMLDSNTYFRELSPDEELFFSEMGRIEDISTKEPEAPIWGNVHFGD